MGSISSRFGSPVASSQRTAGWFEDDPYRLSVTSHTLFMQITREARGKNGVGNGAGCYMQHKYGPITDNPRAGLSVIGGKYNGKTFTSQRLNAKI